MSTTGKQGSPSVEAAQKLAKICESRALLWKTVAEVFSPPTERLLEGFRSGVDAHQLEMAATQLGGERFTVFLNVLNLFQRKAPYSPVASELQLLTKQFTEAFPDASSGSDLRERLVDTASALNEACDQEQVAWLEGNAEAAKSLRLAEADLVKHALDHDLRKWAELATLSSTGPYIRAAVDFLFEVLSVETGRTLSVKAYKA